MNEAEHLIINHVIVNEKEIVVGATNSERWRWDKDEGLSGVDARTIVWVTLTDNGPHYVVSETVGLFCTREDPLRPLALSGINALFEIAWKIKDQQLTMQQAREAFFGHELR